jgi:hypothetical protein
MGLLDNVAALLDAGQLSGGDYLAYLAAFAGDPEPEVTLKVISGLGKVQTTFLVPGGYDKFYAFTRELLRPALTRIGVKPAAGEPDYLAPLRNALYFKLGTAIADPEVITAARELATQYLQNPASIDATLARAALAVAAYHGDAAFLDRICAELEKTGSPAARSNYIGTVGDFHDPALVDRALAYSLTPALKSTEFLSVAGSISGDPERRRQVVDWTMANFEAIRTKAPPQRTANLIFLADGGDTALFAELKKFLLDPARTSQSAEANAAKAGDRVAVRAILREKELASVEAFLSTYPHKTPTDRAK